MSLLRHLVHQLWMYALLFLGSYLWALLPGGVRGVCVVAMHMDLFWVCTISASNVQDLSLLLLRLCPQPALMDSTPISSGRTFPTVCLHPHAKLSLLPLLRSTWFCSTAHLYQSIFSGSTPKFSCCCLQSAVTQLKEVRDDKVQNRSGITQEDASKIAAAEAALHDGQVPANSVSSKAQVGFQ